MISLLRLQLFYPKISNEKQKNSTVLMEELKKKEDTLLLKLKVDNKDIMLLPVSIKQNLPVGANSRGRLF